MQMENQIEPQNKSGTSAIRACLKRYSFKDLINPGAMTQGLKRCLWTQSRCSTLRVRIVSTLRSMGRGGKKLRSRKLPLCKEETV